MMDVNEYQSLVHNTQKPMKCELVNHFISKHHKPIFYEKKLSLFPLENTPRTSGYDWFMYSTHWFILLGI